METSRQNDVSASAEIPGGDYGYWHNVVASGSTFLNVLRGGPREPICTTIHNNIMAGGIMSRVPFPQSWLNHFEWSARK